jgi:hypothetical protein
MKGSCPGTVSGSVASFHYRNSFLQMIRGSVRPDTPGAIVDVSLELHPVVSVFMALWLGITGLFGVVLILAVLLGHGSGDPALGLVATFGMFALGYLLMHGAFAFEVGNVRQLLDEVTRP